MNLGQVQSPNPEPGVDYSQVLVDGEPNPVRAVLTGLFGLTGYVLVVPLVIQLLLALGWVVTGMEGAFGDYYRRGVRFENEWGLVASHIGLATLIVLSIAVARLMHGRQPRWMASVQPGMRWRYLVICLVVAAVVLNAFVLPERIRAGWNPAAEEGVWLWLVLVLLTSPFQAAGEEYFFRGLLLQAFGSAARNQWVGIIGSSLVFAVMHGMQNPALFAHRFGFGVLAGILVVRTGGLEASIACHVANNIFAFGWAVFFGGIAQVRATQAITWVSAGLGLASFATFAVVAWWIGRRMNLAVRTPELVPAPGSGRGAVPGRR